MELQYNFHTPWSLRKELIVDGLHKIKHNNKYAKPISKKFILEYLSDIDRQLYLVEDIHMTKILLHELCKYLCFGTLLDDKTIYDNPYIKNADEKEIKAVNKILKSIKEE